MVFKFLSPIQKPPDTISATKYKVFGILCVIILACAAGLALFGKNKPATNQPININNTVAASNSNVSNGSRLNIANTITNTVTNVSVPANANAAGTVTISSFTAMTANAACADVRNDLYLIDGKLVFWVRTGKCPDAAYAYILYGQTPQEKLCSYTDSIAGPQESCLEASYQELFSSMIHAVDDQQLGLDSSHTVAKVSQ